MTQNSSVKSNILDLIEVDVSELTPFQGKLKTLSPENYQKLKAEILETGFNFAQHVWPSESKLFIIDGHQRKTALEMMRAEGFQVPKVKVVRVQAPSYQAAKRMVLQGISQYGKVDSLELPDFAKEAGLSLDQIPLKFDLPNVDARIFSAAPPEEPKAPESRDKDEPKALANNGMKNLVLYFPEAQYPEIVKKAEAARAARGLNDFAELFEALLNEDAGA